MDHYKSNIFLIKSPFILSQKFNNNVIVFFLKTKLPMNFIYHSIKNDFKSYHTSRFNLSKNLPRKL